MTAVGNATKLGPNCLQACGTDGAKKRHWAKAERCDTCGTEGRTPTTPVVAR